MDYLNKLLKEPEKRIYLFVFLLILVLIYLLLPIIHIFIIGAILAYLTHPFYKKLNKKIKSKGFCSFIISLLTIFLIIFPFIYLILELINQTLSLYKTLINEKSIFTLKEEIIKIFYYLIPHETIREKLIDTLIQSENYIFKVLYKTIIDILSYFPSIIANMFAIIIAQYYFLIYGKNLINSLKILLPFGKYNEKLFINLKKTIDSLIFGLLIPSLIQTLLLVLFLILLNIKINYFFVGLLAFVFSFIPFLGTWVVWLPIAIKLWFVSKIKSIILILYGLLFLSNIDNITRIYITSKIGRLPFWLVLLSIFGGLISKGFVGMLIILSLSSFVYYIYIDLIQKNENEK